MGVPVRSLAIIQGVTKLLISYCQVLSKSLLRPSDQSLSARHPGNRNMSTRYVILAPEHLGNPDYVGQLVPAGRWDRELHVGPTFWQR